MGVYIGYKVFGSDVYAIALHSLFGIITQISLIYFVILMVKKHDRQHISSFRN
jgi:hypothetical protein